jgi:hypothetical protein
MIIIIIIINLMMIVANHPPSFLLPPLSSLLNPVIASPFYTRSAILINNNNNKYLCSRVMSLHSICSSGFKGRQETDDTLSKSESKKSHLEILDTFENFNFCSRKQSLSSPLPFQKSSKMVSYIITSLV